MTKTWNINFYPLAEPDFPLLLKWLEMPHVKAWWEKDVIWTPDLIYEKYASYVNGYKLHNGVSKPISAYIISVDGIPIGYIQLYNAYDFPHSAPLIGLPLMLAAFDMFIGEEQYLKKGIASKAIVQFFHEHGRSFTHIFADPNSANVAAIRAYEKAGFKKINEQPSGGEVWMLRKQEQPSEVDEILHHLKKGIVRNLGKAVEGIYLTGSLSYGDFNPESSDIDLLVVLNKPVSKDELEALNLLHLLIAKNHRKWAKRIECSYITRDMLQSIEPPKTPRPYLNEGTFYAEAPYGNEWIINQYLLYQHGIPLVGPNFKTLAAPIDISDVREACIRDLLEEWEPKIHDVAYLKNPHHQSYLVLTLCRILYTVIYGEVVSKKVAASWVKREFSPRWDRLIQAAEDWHYGESINRQEEAVEFIKFVINRIKEFQSR